MPKPSQSGFKRFFYNQNIKRDKSNDKYKNLHNHVVLLLKKMEKEGATKWIDNAVARAQNKITKYGINLEQMMATLERKAITKLQKLLEENFFFVVRKGSKKVAAVKIVQKKAVAPKKTPADIVEKLVVAKKPVVAKKVAAVKTVQKKAVAPKKTPVKAKKS